MKDNQEEPFDFVKSLTEAFEEERRRQEQRRKDFEDNSHKPIVITEAERLIHQRSDRLLGLYPMNKKTLLEQIKLMHDGLMVETFTGFMYSGKALAYALAAQYLDENDLNKIYDYYLTEVKPYINKKL